MEWLTETPLYTIMIGSLITGFFALVWFISHKRVFFAFAVMTVIGMIAGAFPSTFSKHHGPGTQHLYRT